MATRKQFNDVWNDVQTGMIFLVLDADMARMSEIHFCPWCGTKVKTVKANESIINHGTSNNSGERQMGSW